MAKTTEFTKDRMLVASGLAEGMPGSRKACGLFRWTILWKLRMSVPVSVDGVAARQKIPSAYQIERVTEGDAA